MSAVLSRRLLLGGLAGAALSARGARAGDDVHAVAVGCWGGAYGEALQAAVDGPLQRNAGITVRQVLSAEPARVAAILAADGPSLDVALLSDVDAYRLSLRQLFVPVTTAGVGALPHIAAGLRAPYGVPQGRTALCIAYNPAKVSAGVPSGFAALFEAARKGKVGFSSELAVHNLAAAAIAQRSAGASLEAAKSTFLALKHAGTLRIYPTNEALGQAFASGEIIMAPMWRSRTYVWRKAGQEVHDAIPVEGAIPFTILACVPKNASRTGVGTASAMLYLDALLHPQAQTEVAQRVGLLPTIDTVRLDDALLRQIGFTASQRSRFRPIGLAAVAQNGVALRRFWDQELA